MSEVTCIGRCKGCDRMRRLDDGVCNECLQSDSRGRVWAERAHRCRTDPEYAKTVYESIQKESGKRIFAKMFGYPPGVTPIQEKPVPTGTIR